MTSPVLITPSKAVIGWLFVLNWATAINECHARSCEKCVQHVWNQTYMPYGYWSDTFLSLCRIFFLHISSCLTLWNLRSSGRMINYGSGITAVSFEEKKRKEEECLITRGPRNIAVFQVSGNPNKSHLKCVWCRGETISKWIYVPAVSLGERRSADCVSNASGKQRWCSPAVRQTHYLLPIKLPLCTQRALTQAYEGRRTGEGNRRACCREKTHTREQRNPASQRERFLSRPV